MSDDTRTIIDKLIAARANFETVKFDGINPMFKSRYATLKSINDAVDAALVAEGLVPMWKLSVVNGGAGTVFHPSEESLSSGVVSFGCVDPQKAGSAITYGKRYSKSALLGIVAEDDDDGNAASTPAKAKEAPSPAYSPAHTPSAPPASSPASTAPSPGPTAEDTAYVEAQVRLAEAKLKSAGHPDSDDENDCDPGFPDDKGKHWKDGPSKAQIGRIYGMAKSKGMEKGTWKAYIAATYGVTNPYRLHWKQYKEFTEQWMEQWIKDIPF